MLTRNIAKSGAVLNLGGVSPFGHHLGLIVNRSQSASCHIAQRKPFKMITFERHKHFEIDENFQGINLTEFSFKFDKDIDNEEIIGIFIRSENFTYDSLRDCIRNEPDKSYLKRAFDFHKIKIEDFRKFDKDELSKFLTDFLNDPDWGADKNDFAKLLDKYIAMHKALDEIDYYIISKSWFNKDDDRLMEPESWVYNYYFLIISLDRISNSLILAEWSYD